MPKDDHSPAFLLYVQDFVSDSKVEAMTTREVGAYFLLLCKAWFETPVGTIPNNDRVLARWARLTPDEWSECRDAVLAPFKACTDNRLISPRLSSEFRKLMESRKKRATAGKAGADSRWQTHGKRMANACDCQCDRNANAMAKDAISSSISKETTTHTLSPQLLNFGRDVLGLTCDSLLGGWLALWPEDWIILALSKCQGREMRGSEASAYAQGILRRWKKQGGPENDGGTKPQRTGKAIRISGGGERKVRDYSDVVTGERL